MTVHAWVQSSPKSKTHLNFDPDLTRRATTDDSSAVRGMVWVHAEDRSSSAISSATTAVPSSRVNCLRWDRSHRARARSIACPRSSNVAPGGRRSSGPVVYDARTIALSETGEQAGLLGLQSQARGATGPPVKPP